MIKSPVNKHDVNIGLCFLAEVLRGFLFLYTEYFLLLLSEANLGTSGWLCLKAKGECSTGNGNGNGNGRWQCQEHHHVSSTKTDKALTLVIGTVMHFTHASGPAGSDSFFWRKAEERHSALSAAMWDAAWHPCSPSPCQGRHPCPQASPALACSTFHSRALLLSVYFWFFIPGLFFKAQGTPADGKLGTEGRMGCSGSA